MTLRRLAPVELLGADRSFLSFANPVGIFVGDHSKKLVAICEFDELFDLNGNRFSND